MSAAQLAVNWHVPVPAVMVTVLPATEHEPVLVMDGVVLALVVAATLNDVPITALVGAPVKVTVGVARSAATTFTTLVAALKLALPAWDAVNVQEPVPLVMLTVPLVMVQEPVAAMVTGRPDVAVAETANVLL